uniref:J domain-containing protein n=1 Tax=Graphocephala atropunctata TaxID=36148 RepID=A0A1B6KEU4_9HEMI
MKSSTFIFLLMTLVYETKAATMLEGFYCGPENCYEVLGVARDTSKSDIAKAYRKLAKKYHPDMYRKEEEKTEAEANFKRIANAYEILKDDETRNDYDYMLDHPEEVYSHYYRYYRKRLVPTVDVRLVIAGTISVISIIQYFTAWQRYETAITFLLTVPKYRNRAMQIAREERLLDNGKKTKGKTKAEIKEKTEAVLRQVMEDNIDIRGGNAKPEITDLLVFQLFFLPYTLSSYLYWYASWIIAHNLRGLPLSDEEKLYLIRKFMKKGVTQFEALEASSKEEFIKQDLWIKEKFDIWAKEKEEEQKKQLAENARYKAYRRHVKNHGTGRMTFDDS